MNPQNKAPVELPFPLPISLYCSASEGVVKAELALAKQKLIGTAPKQKKVGLCARETRTPFTRTASVVTVKNVTWIKVDARAIHAGDSYLDDLPWYAKKKRGDRVHPRAFHSTYKGTPCPTLGWNADDVMLEPDTPVVTRTYECNGRSGCDEVKCKVSLMMLIYNANPIEWVVWRSVPVHVVCGRYVIYM
jgi:hypothetical protein